MLAARPDTVLVGAALAGAATTAGVVVAVTSWWWARLTRTEPP